MWVAVTGNIGSGKSTFAACLRECGAVVVDADAEARRVVDESQALRQELADAFGSDLLDSDGVLDRRALAARALGDAESRQRLERIVRPHLEPRLYRALQQSDADHVVLDAPLVFEWGIQDWFDRIYWIRTADATAAARVSSSRGMSTDEVAQRRAAQIRHDHIDDDRVIPVDNNGSLDDLRATARQLWTDLSDTAA